VLGLKKGEQMQITVTQVSDVKTNQQGTSSKVHAGNDYYYVNEDATQYIGKTLEITSEEKTSQAGRKYKVAKILNVLGGAPAASANGNGKVEWSDYDKLARVAHKLALELEPDTIADEANNIITVDRSRARVTFVNTALMALKDGKLWLDDDIPF
jgi:hypothetical protein